MKTQKSFILINLFSLIFIVVSFLNAESNEVGPLRKNWLRKFIDDTPYKPCQIKGMIGEKPGEVCSLIDDLLSLSKNNGNSGRSQSKRMILYGPQGTGKSFTAQKIAEESQSAFISIDSSAIVKKFINEGAETVEEIFKNAIEQAEIEKRPVVIFFDEIDVIAKKNDTEMRSEQAAATTRLWNWLDKTKNNPNICFIAATNYIEELHPSVKTRLGNNLVEIKNPDLNARKQIIAHFLKQQNWTITDKYAEELAAASDGLCERDFEMIINNLVHECKKNNLNLTSNMIMTSIKKVKESSQMSFEEKMKWYKQVGEAMQPFVIIVGVVVSVGLNVVYTIGKTTKEISDQIK